MQPAAPSFSDFFILGNIAESAIRYTQVDWFMVALSYMVAALAAYLAMMILSCVHKSRNKTHQIALGAITLGTGIWSMHFIGMLAGETKMVHHYDPITTVVSWLVAVSFSYVILHNFAYKRITGMRIVALAPLLALGIVAMHYIGMSAMRMKALMHFEFTWFMISVAIALVASTVALIMMRHATQTILTRPYLTRMGTALVIAIAICGMHYSGMAATVFTPFADCIFDENQYHIELVLLIAACTLIVMGAATLLVLWTSIEATTDHATRRWPYVYYMLAGFNMLTVGAGLYMNHLSIEVQVASEEARDTWLDYSETLLKLNQSISQLLSSLVQYQASSHSIQGVQSHLETLIDDVRAFERLLAENEHDHNTSELASILKKNLRHEYEGLLHLRADLDVLRKAQAMDAAMLQHIEQHAAEFHSSLAFASGEIAKTQDAITTQGSEQIDTLMKINAVIYFVLITLVLLTTAGGVKVVRRIRQTQEEKSQYLSRLQESEASLTESLAFLKKIIDSVADPIFVKNRRHQWIAVNGAFSEMLGYEAEMLIGKSDFDIFPNEQASVFWEMDEKLFNAGEVVVNEERIRTRSGEDRTILTKKVPVTLSDGTTGIVGIFHDITEQNMIRDELRRHRDNLAQMVAEQTKDLLDAKNKAEQANKAKSEFLSNMSHELRTPIHAIKSFAELSRDLIGRELNDQERHKISRFMHNVIVSVDRLNLLVGDLLDMSKLDSGKVQYHFEHVNVPALVSHCFDQLHGLMLDKDIRYDIDVGQHLAMADVDQRTMTQVMINLLSNAIKFSPENGTLSCTIAVDGADHLLISLSDEGPGIPESELGAIFDKFVQSSKTKTKAGGTGLGLAICLQIVEAHHGQIWYENNKTGQGATAFVRLPIHQKTP